MGCSPPGGANKDGEDGPEHAAEEHQCVLWRGHEGARSDSDGGDGVLRPVHRAPCCSVRWEEGVLLHTLHLSGKTLPLSQSPTLRCFRLALNQPNTRRFEHHFLTSHRVVFSPPGVHGSSVRLHNVPLRVKERSGDGRVAHSQHLPAQGSEQISSQRGPLRCGADPQRAARTLRHVPALSVRPAVSVLPRQTAERVSLLSQGAKGEWTGCSAAAAGAENRDCTTEQPRPGGKPPGVPSRNDPGRWVTTSGMCV